jgi:ribonuclease BN (tRNA processing enzyme)
MKITFLGTGDSCDPHRKNVSVLVEDNGRAHMLDCGFSSTQGFLARSPQTRLVTIWISHFHGDHFFGLPQLILHLNMQKRTEPLAILSGMHGEEKILKALHLAYPELATKLSFSLDFTELQPGTIHQHNGLSWKCAPVIHSQSAHSLRISSATKSLYYSGDGKAMNESAELMQSCDLVIHEAFSLKASTPYHSSIDECLQLAERLSIAKLALVHLNQDTREILNESSAMLSRQENTTVFFPLDDEELIL